MEDEHEQEVQAIVQGRSTEMYRKLNANQMKACQLRALGKSQVDAYLMAGYKVEDRKDAAAAACNMFRKPHVQAYLTELKKASWLASAVSIEEKRNFLARVIRTPIGELDETSDLVHSLEYTEHGKKIKAHDKLKAIELDAKIAGELDASEKSVNVLQIEVLNARLLEEKQAQVVEV